MKGVHFKTKHWIGIVVCLTAFVLVFHHLSGDSMDDVATATIARRQIAEYMQKNPDFDPIKFTEELIRIIHKDICGGLNDTDCARKLKLIAQEMTLIDANSDVEINLNVKK